METSVTLKVCEGCGCLWYRHQANASPYCAPCAVMFKDFPTVESRKRRGRPPKPTPVYLPVVYANAEEANV